MGESSLNTKFSTSRHLQELQLTDDSVDLDDFPVYIALPHATVNSRKRQILSILFIYTAVMFLSFASHSVYYTYIPYLVPKSSDGDSINLFLLLLGFGTAFVTGLFTDKHLHRYWLIIFGYFLYFIGYVMFYLVTNDTVCKYGDENSASAHHCGVLNLGSRIMGTECSCFLLASLVLIGVGVGLAWGHTAVFGADQIQSPTLIAVYFHGYYLAYQIGIAFTLYIVSTKTTTDYNVLGALGLAGCTLSFSVFVAGTPFYQPEFTKHLQDPFIYLLRQLVCNRKNRSSMDSAIDDDGPSSRRIAFFGAVIRVGEFDRQYVDGLKRFLRLLLIFILLVPFETVFNVQLYLFQLQASEMKYPPWNIIDESKLRYPLNWFTFGYNILTLVLLIPALVLVWYVSSKRGNHRWSFTFTRDAIHYRLIAGLLIAALSIVLGGIVSSVQLKEHQRCLDQHLTDSSECYRVYQDEGTSYVVSGINILWTTPQNVLSALSEILVEITIFQLAYLDAPSTQQYRMHGKFVSLIYLSGMLGCGLGSLLLQAGTSYYCETETNDGCLLIHDNFIWFLYILGWGQLLAALLVLVAVVDYFRWSETGKSILC